MPEEKPLNSANSTALRTKGLLRKVRWLIFKITNHFTGADGRNICLKAVVESRGNRNCGRSRRSQYSLTNPRPKVEIMRIFA